MSYAYELSAWIYKVIENADADFSDFLHRQGHQTPQKKSFKLFCFSQLEVPRRRIEADRLHIECPEVSLWISFYVDRTAVEFVRGLFQEQQFTLGDRFSRASFSVKTVEVGRPFTLTEGQTLKVRALSPIVVSRKHPNQPDEYLNPQDPDFGRLLYQNLLEKYRAATQHEAPAFWNPAAFGFRCLDANPKSKLITIKSGKAAQTRVRGWMFEFEALLPRELAEIGLLAGWGRHNAEGFGMGVVR